MKSALAVLLPALIVLQAYAQNKLCQPGVCPPGVEHVTCKGNDNFAATCPRTVKVINIQSEMLTLHNDFRNRLALGNIEGQPGAAQMTTLTWDAELAGLAVRSLKQCRGAGDQCRNTAKYNYVGQNFFKLTVTGLKPDVKKVVNNTLAGWLNTGSAPSGGGEAEEGGEEAGGEEEGGAEEGGEEAGGEGAAESEITPFAQMFHDKSNKIGCGAIQYVDAGDVQTMEIICNYSSSPDGDTPYTAGCAASSCTKGTNNSFKGLCSPNEVVLPNERS